MLVPNQLVEVKMSGKTISHYRKLGYEVKDIKSILNVPVAHLTKGSHVEVKLICDCCKEPFSREYKRYLQCNDNGIDYCEFCGKGQRTQNTIKEKYGVDNVMGIPGVKEKIKETCFERYGVEYYSSTDEYKEKVKQTCLEKYGASTFLASPYARNKINITVKEKYGVEYIGELDFVHTKAKHTNLERYGVEAPSQSKEILEKIQNTCMERYGTKTTLENEKILEKIKQTNLLKYGVENVFSSKEIQDKIKETNLEKYGVPNIMQSIVVQKKAKNTMLERYGYEYVLQVPELREKIFETMRINGNTPTSSQQLSVYNMIKEKYPNAILNYPFNKFSFDVFLLCDDIKIDIEYDGWYWHQDKQRDRRRDEYVKSQGFKILRIKSGNKLPAEEQLFEAINKLVKTNYKYTEIILDDWKEGEESA